MPIQQTTERGTRRRKSSTNEQPPLTVSRPELLVEGSDAEFRAFIHGMLAFTARIETVRAGFAKLIGLTSIQYTLLIAIGHLEAEPTSITMVASHLHLSGAFVTAEVGKLLERGLVTKFPDKEDRRRVCLSLTRKGSDLLKKLAPTQAKVNDVLFQFPDGSHFRQLKDLVNQMVLKSDQAVSLLSYLTHEQTGREMSGVNRFR